jgi:hypothetical protein
VPDDHHYGAVDLDVAPAVVIVVIIDGLDRLLDDDVGALTTPSVSCQLRA